MLGSHTENGCSDLKQNKIGDGVTKTQERENLKTQEVLVGDILATNVFSAWRMECDIPDK